MTKNSQLIPSIMLPDGQIGEALLQNSLQMPTFDPDNLNLGSSIRRSSASFASSGRSLSEYDYKYFHNSTGHLVEWLSLIHI